MEEGCLSLPEQYADVERPKQIIVEYTDENEKLIKEKLMDMKQEYFNMR